jgi:transposase
MNPNKALWEKGDFSEIAEPHTKSQLKHIEELKKKHGIDYDSHASYRFVEE